MAKDGRGSRLAKNLAGVVGILVVAYLVQRVALNPTFPFWWRMLLVGAPLFAGVLVVQMAFSLGSRRRRPGGRPARDDSVNGSVDRR